MAGGGAATAADSAAAANDAVAASDGMQLRPLASHFDRPCLLGPLLASQDELAHMHANTQLPVLQVRCTSGQLGPEHPRKVVNRSM